MQEVKTIGGSNPKMGLLKEIFVSINCRVMIIQEVETQQENVLNSVLRASMEQNMVQFKVFY